MKRLDAPAAVAAGAALVLAASAFVVGAARWNRAGEPEARLAMTERELALPQYRDKEDTSLFLEIALGDRPPAAVERTAWLTGRRPERVPPGWLDAGALRGLGFDLAALETAARDLSPDGAREARATRPALVVLEYEGEAWRSWIAGREAEVAALRAAAESGSGDRARLAEAEALLAIDRTARSRLMPVDVGLDAKALRSRHPDRARCAVVPGFVTARVAIVDGALTIEGTIDRLAVGIVTVPHALRPRLLPFAATVSEAEWNRRLRDDAAASRTPEPVPPRYAAELAYGRALDPWLAAADSSPGSTPSVR